MQHIDIFQTIFATSIPILVAVVVGLFGVHAHAKQAEHRLKIEHRLKLLMLAHEAVQLVTDACADGAEALARLNVQGPSSPILDDAWRMRQTIDKAAVHLPPALYEAFDRLRKVYGDADTGVFAIVRDGPAASGLSSIHAFRNAINEWEAKVREWKVSAWKELERS